MEGILMVVKRHTRADNINHGNPLMSNSRFDQFFNLFRISGERPGNKVAFEIKASIARSTAKMDSFPDVSTAVLFRCGRELTFGQTIDPLFR